MAISNSVWRNFHDVGSGAVIIISMSFVLIALISMGQSIGWGPTWRAIGVTPLQTPFTDMHIITAYAACAANGFDGYVPHSCLDANFNIPPVWLWLGYVGVDESWSVCLSIVITAVAAIVIVALFSGAV